ncbi:hypothetical protein ACRALDRAFT_2044747 [Sodiomyces alcalophilus JCM 7366]|uniref:uncharacterized protein n=1 Tax=Sodiomyces alcalophilus JCM 7366 TaxID=591952 RepID=UPI0039B525F5
MTFDEKFQAGEAYGNGDAHHGSRDFLLEDPVKIATQLVKDYAGVRRMASIPELAALIRQLLHKGEPIDDRQGTTELLIGILAGLPSDSKLRTQLTNKLIDTLWDDLQHPPLSYVGGDVKYEVVDSKEQGPHLPTKNYDSIEFKVPGTDVTLREHAPQSPDGVFQYRMPDGSFNNVLDPNLGKAGSSYAKSVRATKTLHGVKPDPGLLFDLLMARDDENFKENEAGISSMLFYHASIIIHDIFRTSRTDMNKTDTSSYLDLAPLYGSSLKDQLEVRTMKHGKLKPDTFHEKRLLGQPAGVNVMLVLYSRFHNYVCDVLLQINENGRFTLACGDDASPEQKAQAAAKQDHDLFNTARLIVGGLYINISLHDYLRAITNTHHSDSDWTLDPRVDMSKQYDDEGAPRGVGNQVSVEFNLLYRFHACISKKDERWMENFFLKLFPGHTVEDLPNISWTELGKALAAYEATIPKDPSARTFDGLERQEDGTFKDEDLVRILKEAMEDPAGSFGARRIPKALKIVEILGINQARKWQVASLNEFREFFGLKRYEAFTDINANPDIAGILEKLYTDPDMVELYPGLMIEDIKPVRNPGCGITPNYTLGRAVLSDAITLVRSDRFNTLDYTVANLTAWGYNEVQQDYKTLGGSMLYKLIQRGLPNWFPYNSIAVMQPMYTKKANEKIAKELGTIHQFTLDDPKPPRKAVVISTGAAIKQALGDPAKFTVPWLQPINDMFPGPKGKDLGWFMLAGDGPENRKNREDMTKAMGNIPNLHGAVREFIERVGAQLLEKETFTLREGLHQIDLIRDIAIPLNAQLLSDMFYFDLRTDENPDGTLSAAEFYRHLLNIRTWGANNNDPAQAWNRRRRAQEGADVIIKTTRKLVDEVSRSRGLGFGVASALSNVLTRKTHIKKDSLRACGLKFVEELLAQGHSAERVVDTLWLTAFGGVGAPVTAFYEIMEYFLHKDNAAIWAEVQRLVRKNDDATLSAYIREAQRLTSSQRNVRVATQPAELEGQSIQPGNVVIMLMGNAGRNPDEVVNANTFDPNRKTDEVGAFSYGPHECFGKHIATTFITGLVKLVADLKKLRPAPRNMGEVKTVRIGSEKSYLNDSWSYLSFDPSTWKLHFDGRGEGVFEDDGEPEKETEMQKYYYAIKERKAKLRLFN